jgi:hypothetical protein
MRDKIRGLCPICLQRLKDADSILSVQEREERDKCEWQQNQESHHHLQYLRYYVDERDSFRNVMVQDYLKSLEQESEFVKHKVSVADHTRKHWKDLHLSFLNRTQGFTSPDGPLGLDLLPAQTIQITALDFHPALHQDTDQEIV